MPYTDLSAFFSMARIRRHVISRGLSPAFTYCTCPDGKQCNSCK